MKKKAKKGRKRKLVFVRCLYHETSWVTALFTQIMKMKKKKRLLEHCDTFSPRCSSHKKKKRE